VGFDPYLKIDVVHAMIGGGLRRFAGLGEPVLRKEVVMCRF